MATNSMRLILLLFLPFLLTVQVANGAVLIENKSEYNVSVYDTNTTNILDPLEPGQTTSFPLESAGPDLFQIIYEVNAFEVSNFTILIDDGYTLKVSNKKHGISKTPPGPVAAPSPNPAGITAGGS